MRPLIAIVGRPNVGKSHLFNRITGERLAIVEDTPGVTRDRLYGKSDWAGHEFDIVDTGGIEPKTSDDILLHIRHQAQIAIDLADVIVFVCDVSTGVTAADEEIAAALKRAGKPVAVAVNKCDGTGAVDTAVYEFYSLGFGEPFPVSAVHGHGTGDLLDYCISNFPDYEKSESEDERIRVAIIGKPNAGKSSLLNNILGETRTIVSEEAGTTRDAIDASLNNEFGKYIFIDTAGLRRKSRVDTAIEKYSILRAEMAIERSNVCLIMIDAQEGVTEQDTKIAGLAHEAGKASILVVNKWDLVEKSTNTMDNYRKLVYNAISYMTYAPVAFISAKTGARVDRLFELINYVDNQSATRISTGMLNSLLADATARVQPPTYKGRRLKIYYITQADVRPPTFVCFCNNAELFHFSYQRYIENQIRSSFGLEGTPVRIVVRERGEDGN